MADPSFQTYIGFTQTSSFSVASLTNISSWVQRIRVDRGRDVGFGHIVAGRAMLEVDNATRVFTPQNSASPYYNNMRPNRVVFITATHPGSNATPFFRGYIDSWTVDPAYSGRTAVIEATDNTKLLVQRRVDMPIAAATQANSLIIDVLSYAVILGPNSIDATITDGINFAWFADQEAQQALQALVEFGQYTMFAINSSDGFAFKDRHYNVNSVSPVASYVNAFFGLKVKNSDEGLVNVAAVGGEARKIWTGQAELVGIGDVQRTVVAVWPATIESNSGSTTAGSQTTIPASSAITFEVGYRDPFNEEPAPCASLRLYPHLLDGIAGDVILINVGSVDVASGGYAGGDITTTASYWMDDHGDSATLHIFNGTSVEGYLWRARIRGRPLQRSLINQGDSSVNSSINEFGRHSFSFQSPLFSLDSYAQDYADFITARYHDLRPQLELTLKNQWPDQVDRDLLDVVWVVESYSAISSLWQIWGISHEITVGRGLEHTTTWTLDQWKPMGLFVLDVDQLDIGRLGF